MENRKTIIFKLDGEVILEERCNLYLNQIDELKWNIALELGCTYDDIEVETIEVPIEMSDDVDVSSIGLIFWKDTYFTPITGTACDLKEGSDAYLDAIADGSIIDYIRFIK
jgi:hypothetical protein